jgi:hypothetical protein
MKNPFLTLLALTLSLAILSFTACGKKEPESKTVIIEKPVAVQPKPEPKPNVSITVEGDGKNTRYEVHGEK